MALKELNLKVVSYCDIPEPIGYNHSVLMEISCGCFIHWNLSTDDSQDDELDAWIRSEYPELIGTDFLIEMDY